MVEEADPHVGAEQPDHVRNQLQMIVVDPDGGSKGGRSDGRLREAGIDRLVCAPPRAMVLRSDDEVVVERPEHAIGEPLVIGSMLCLSQGDRNE